LDPPKSLFASANSTDPYGNSPWPKHGVMWLTVPPSLASELAAIVDRAEDESSIQRFLETHPALIAQLLGGGHGRWVFARHRLGSEHIPDFMLCERDSGGYHWTLIELESPMHRPMTKAGEQSAKLTHALHQIRDWRIWLRKNIQYAHQELGFVDLDLEFKAMVVIGRRSMQKEEHRERYRELSDAQTTVMSYDRLVDQIRSSCEAHAALFPSRSKSGTTKPK
jgi:hypothetical protein